MQFVWNIFYNFCFIPLFWLLLHLAAFFNKKIKRGIQGRSGLFERLEQAIHKLTSKRRVWFHSSSMGEFEQAKPIIAALRKKYSDINIIVTFFSPSGYDHTKNYKLADIITYIPFDSRSNARKFVTLIRPTAAVFVRYDVWPNHLQALAENNIPAFIANATMRDTSSRFYPGLKSFHHQLYNALSSILAVSQSDVRAFQRFALDHPTLEAIGETRYDQVWQRSAEARQKHLIPPAILKGKKVILAGSIWPEDEAVLIPSLKTMLEQDKKAFVILVPHEPTEEAIEDIEKELNSHIKSLRFSALNDYHREQVIIVDSVGILMALYQYAQVAYVGGSFHQGIHNVLEPAVYGIPVVYGPRHTNSQEAIELARRGGGFVVTDQPSCYRTLNMLLSDKKAQTDAGAIALTLVKENVGATERFMKHLEQVL